MIMHARKAAALTAVLISVTACSPAQRDKVDSAAGKVDSFAGAAADAARAVLSVIDVDMGRKAGPDKKITDKTDEFARSDTIFASVHTSGTAKVGMMVGTWTFPDSSVVEQKTDTPTEGDAYTTFFITKPRGLAPGKYTFRVMVDGREVRSKDVTVK
jgi:hypothetical protein